MTERSAEEIKRTVQDRYANKAREQLQKQGATAVAPVDDGECCGPGEDSCKEISTWAEETYSAQDLGTLPKEATDLSLGCGNPTAIAELRPGDAVLDLGSGSGLDCFLAGQQVGPEGRVVGLDMTDDMLELARRNLAKVGAGNVEFQKGEMESMPLPDASFDVIISNCVINLSPDKDAVFRESLRVLKPGGRLRVSDIVWTRPPTAEERATLAEAGCVAGALELDDYVARLRAAGFRDVETEFVAEPDERGFASAYVTATKPAITACC